MEPWTIASTLPLGVKPVVICLGPNGLLAVGGHLDDRSLPVDLRLASRQPRLFLGAQGTLAPTPLGERGSVVLLGACEGFLAALVAIAKPDAMGSYYCLYCSNSWGSEWEPPVECPIVGPVQFLVGPGNDLWILGARNTLINSADGGRSWAPVDFPTPLDPFRDRLLQLDEATIALAGKGLWTTRDRGQSWQTAVSPNLEVSAAHVDLLIALSDGKSFLARFSTEGVERLGSFPADRLPLQLVAADGLVRVLSRYRDPAAGTGLQLRQTRDDGQTWETLDLDASPLAAIAGERYGAAVAWQGRILQPTA